MGHRKTIAVSQL